MVSKHRSSALSGNDVPQDIAFLGQFQFLPFETNLQENQKKESIIKTADNLENTQLFYSVPSHRKCPQFCFMAKVFGNALERKLK